MVRQAFKRSKRFYFKELCEQANTDVWGAAYKILSKKLHRSSTCKITYPKMLKSIVCILFPRHKIGGKNASDSDGIPYLVLKLAIYVCVRKELFIETFQKSIDERVFHKIWKQQKVKNPWRTFIVPTNISS